MTREEAKELLPIIQAYADGKTIQLFDEGKWKDVYETDFYGHPDKYRINTDLLIHKKNVGRKCTIILILVG